MHEPRLLPKGPHALRPAENSTGWDACSTLAPAVSIRPPKDTGETTFWE